MKTIEEIRDLLLKSSEEIRSEGFVRALKKGHLSIDVPSILITGSNGKGSTAFYLTLLASKRYSGKVGTLYNSYLALPNESICIGGEPVSKEIFEEAFDELSPLFENFELTSPEMMVCLAASIFQKEKVEFAILECFMGGIDDPCVVIHPKMILSIITNVALEHTEYLGTTLSEIAYSCSGVIAKKVPLLTGALDPVSEDALKIICAKNKTSITHLDRPYLPHLVNGNSFVFDYPPYKGIAISTFASYQVWNACMALHANKMLPELSLSESEIQEAFAGKSLPGRLERFGNVVLDSACNGAAVDALCRTMQSVGRGRPVHVLFATKTSCNISVMLSSLDDAASTVTLTSFPHPQAREEMGYALYTEDHEYLANPFMALAYLQDKYPGEAILVTGCQEFVAYMRGLL